LQNGTSNLRIAILTNNANSYPKPMGLGLQRMLSKCGIDSDVITDGWDRIRCAPQLRVGSLRDVMTLKPLRAVWNEKRKARFLKTLVAYDAVVVVSHLPAAYMRYFLDDTAVRKALGRRPVILYDLVYLPTRGGWGDALRNGNPSLGVPEGGHWGIERYDWHLCVSVVSETPLPTEPQPCSIVGLDIDDGSLFPEQTEFRALIDFERPEFSAERSVQLEALQRAGIPYTELRGQYSSADIRAIYRKSAIYFIAFRESFGLPICEVQACGGLVATPYSEWVPSHWIKEDLHQPGPGQLGGNFLVYDNDVEKLTEMLIRWKEQWSAEVTRASFLREYPHYYTGDTTALQRGIEGFAKDAAPSRRCGNLL